MLFTCSDAIRSLLRQRAWVSAIELVTRPEGRDEAWVAGRSQKCECMAVVQTCFRGCRLALILHLDSQGDARMGSCCCNSCVRCVGRGRCGRSARTIAPEFILVPVSFAGISISRNWLNDSPQRAISYPSTPPSSVEAAAAIRAVDASPRVRSEQSLCVVAGPREAGEWCGLRLG